MFRLQPSENLDRFILGQDLIGGRLIYDYSACLKILITDKWLSEEDAKADLLVQVEKINNMPEYSSISENDEYEEDVEYFSGVALLARYDDASRKRGTDGKIFLDFDESDQRTLLENRKFLDVAIMGELVHDHHEIVYNYDVLLFGMLEENPDWTPTDAIEWFEYNTVRSSAYVPFYPLVLDLTWRFRSNLFPNESSDVSSEDFLDD